MIKSAPIVLSILLLVFFFVATISCVSVGQDASELSSYLGARIVESQRTHEYLIGTYFTLRRELIENFIQEEYVPYLLEEYFKLEQVQNNWDIITTENNAEDRNMFLYKTMQALQQRESSMRAEMLSALNKQEQRVRREIAEHYASMVHTNGIITALLTSSERLEESRNSIINLTGIEQDSILDITNQVDGALATLVESSSEIENTISNFLSKIKEE